MSIYNQSSGVIFIHVPKTGGSSIESVNWVGGRGHQSLASFQLELSYNDYMNTTKFAVLRNPWDRFVSTYHHAVDLCQGRTMEEQALALAEHGINEEEMYPEYLPTSGSLMPRSYPIHHHFLPQTFFVKNSRGRLGVDHLLSFETLQEDWESFNEFRGTSRTKVLPHLLRGNRPFDGYRSYFTPLMCDIIYGIYEDDIVLGDYSF